MGVTNGFLRLSRERLDELRTDPSGFESTCRNHDDPNYLDMDKAGWELMFILDPAIVDEGHPDSEPPFPNICKVLGAGETIHEEVDLGYGPAKLIPDRVLQDSISEFENLSIERLVEMASTNEFLAEMLMCELDESMVREYHWPYLDGLSEFVREAVNNDLAVIRY